MLAKLHLNHVLDLNIDLHFTIIKMQKNSYKSMSTSRKTKITEWDLNNVSKATSKSYTRFEL